MTTDRTYDAIVIGGGHNGLVNGAYLAKAGLRTLVLERRQLVGGAAITEELRPGFWFTTFSYALSLLRPDIIQDLELVKHGFMPLLMPSTFAPMVVHDAVRLLTGSAADFLDDYFESDILKGYLASSAIIGTTVGPYSQGSGLVLLYHFIGEHDGVFGAWAFHKRGNGGVSPGRVRPGGAFWGGRKLEAPPA